MAPDRWWVTYESAPKSLNRERNDHWSVNSELTKEWRQAFWGLAKEAKVPHLDRVEIVVHHEVSQSRRGVLPDIGACYPSVKAGVDGIVDAGVIPDDTGDHLVRLVFLPPVRSTRGALTLEIVPA